MNTELFPGEFDGWPESLTDIRVGKSIIDVDAYIRMRDAERPDSRRRAALDRMIQSGDERELTRVTETMIQDLAGLETRQPNCAAVISTLRHQLALSRCAEPPVLRWPSLLLDGPPGVGKTFFARALAELLGNECTLINCSSVTASFVLAGSTPSWADSRPGKVFDTLFQSHLANPIILLDEVDKLAGDHRFDGYGPLHQLLEEGTAQQFVDEHIGLPVDASHILWLATANNLQTLPEPILSRFNVVSIAAPDRAQSEAVAQSVYAELVRGNAGWQRAFARRLPTTVAQAVAGLPPRRMRQALLGAMGNAALNRSHQRTLRLRPKDVEVEPKVERRPIGFFP